MNQKIDEKDLILRIAKGDTEAEQLLFSQFQVLSKVGIMVRRRVTTSRENQNDLINEIAIALLENLRRGKLDPEKGSLGTYMWGVARNKVRDFLKPHRVRKRQGQELEEYLLVDEPNSTGKLEDNDMLQKALSKLDEKYQNVLKMRYLKELEVPEIAEKLGRTPTQVYSQIHYGMSLLRIEVEKLE